MDIDKDAVRLPPPATRRKRPSAVKCVVVLCALIGLAIVASIAFFMGKGFYHLYDNARNPHKDLYLNATTVTAGTEPVVWPFINSDQTFDVYLTIWARLPDTEVEGKPEVEAERAATRERFGGSWETIKKMTKQPDNELLSNPRERVVFSERVFEGVGMRDRNLHRDISFELPLERFRDKFVYNGDVRGAAIVVPRGNLLHRVKEMSGWKPEGAESLGRLDDDTAAQLALSGLSRDVLDATSVSFGMIELHDKNYLNRTEAHGEGDDGEHEYFKDDTEETDESKAKLWKHWQTEQPHFVTKSHIYILDETRPLNRTAFDKKHKDMKDHACGLGLSLPPTRFLCSRMLHGLWEHRLVVTPDEPDNHDRIMYGPKIEILRHMSGPKHLHPLPVRRNKPYDPTVDQQAVIVDHQITFSALSEGRVHLLDNFVMPIELDKNATDAQILQAHSDWEQSNGVLGNRGHGTHPRTRFILGLVEDLFLSFPITVLSLLYWYTRLTTAGLHSFSMLLIASTIVFETLHFVYTGGRSKTVSWEMYVFALVMSGFDLFEAIVMFRLVLLFELVWGAWVPVGVRRTGWTKRERDTRRAEREIDWVRRGLIAAGACAVIYIINKYDLYFIQPLHRMPNEHTDIGMSDLLAAAVSATKITATVLQLALNRQASTFAGQYALEAYLVVIRRSVRLLRFWPWFVGRYETRGGIGYSTLIWIALEGVTVWQAWTLPRVEQSVKGEEDE